MALQLSGPISLGQIQAEFGGSNPASLSEYYRGAGLVPGINPNIAASGTISFGQFYGAAKEYIVTVSDNYPTPQDLRTLAIAAGWNGSDYLRFTNNGIISSNTTSSPALTIAGPFPNGVLFTNNGWIVGMGGRGGDTERVGFAGGPALSVSASATIANNGTIAGGGGGGGAGVFWSWNGFSRSMAGSAGASGMTQSLGGLNPVHGAGGSANPSLMRRAPRPEVTLPLFVIPGASFNWGWGGRPSSPGGKGGEWGMAGDAGGTVDGNYNYSGFAGGAGGAAVTGNNFITWASTGTRLGAVL